MPGGVEKGRGGVLQLLGGHEGVEAVVALGADVVALAMHCRQQKCQGHRLLLRWFIAGSYNESRLECICSLRHPQMIARACTPLVTDLDGAAWLATVMLNLTLMRGLKKGSSAANRNTCSDFEAALPFI